MELSSSAWESTERPAIRQISQFIPPAEAGFAQILRISGKNFGTFHGSEMTGPRWRGTTGAIPREPDRIAHAAACDMTNMPPELLRTLVMVVALRSFTKAAHALGMTQPAVSAQIKRLQVLLGGELLDKSAPGVALTPKGEGVGQHARQLLSVNDEIVGMARPRSPSGLRIGISDEAQSAMLGSVLGACRRASPGSFE